MRLQTFIGRELIERPVPMLSCLVAIVLGVTALVAIRTVTAFSELAVSRELDALGANVLILPKGVSLQDYYAADLHGETLPEEYVDRITLSNLQGVDNLSPKLCVPIRLQSHTVTLTGILPKSEFQGKAAWAGAGIFARPIGCGAQANVPGTALAPARDLSRNRVIETLDEHEALIGADVAAACNLSAGDTIDLLGEAFSIVAILPATGTVDDSRVFAHLHTVQALSGKGEVINVIEVVGCCKQIAAGLVDALNEVLPDVKIATITQVVQTQQNVNRMMERLSLVFLAVLAAAGTAAMASALFANVAERRKEIGTLMALGATPGLIVRLIMGKAIVLGSIGGMAGFLIGSATALWLGPHIANVAVQPIPLLALMAVGVSVAVTLLASVIPAWRASRLDPCLCFKEI